MKILHIISLFWLITGYPSVLGSPLALQGRALDGLINTLDTQIPTTLAQAQEQHAPHTLDPNPSPPQAAQQQQQQQQGTTTLQRTVVTSGPTATPGIDILGLPKPTATGSGSTTANGHPTAALGPSVVARPTEGSSNSIIGTVPPLPSRSSFVPPPQATAGPSSPSDSKTNSDSDSSDSSGSGLNRWKIVGVAVISVGVVMTVLLLSLFFDHWWRFLKDLATNWNLKKSRRRGGELLGDGGMRGAGGGKGFVEELVPDWEKASWEIRVDHRDRERYPSFSGFPQGLSRGGSSKKTRLGTTEWGSAPYSAGKREQQGREVNGLGWETGGGQPVIVRDGAVEKEMDITSAKNSNGGWVYAVPPKAILEHSEVPSVPAATPTAPKRKTSKRRGEDPFQDPKTPAAHQSVYGGIAE